MLPIWLIVGDSITVGMTPHLRTILSGAVTLGMAGVVSASYRSWIRTGYLEELVAETKPDVVVLVLGTNPGEVDVPDRFEEDVRAAATIAGRFGARVVLVGPFAGDDEGHRLAVLRSFIPDAVSGYALAEGLPRAGAGDVHFTPNSYRILAARMVVAIRMTLTSRRQWISGWALGTAVAAAAVLTVGVLALRRSR